MRKTILHAAIATAFFSIFSPIGSMAAPRPAFLDAPDEITVTLDAPIAVADASRSMTVTSENAVIPVARLDAVSTGGIPEPVVLAGTFQPLLGGGKWQPGDPHSRMRRIAKGVYSLTVQLPRGHYEYKIACGGSWKVNYGQGFQPNGANITLDVPAAERVRFVVDFRRRKITTSAVHGSLAADIRPDTAPASEPSTARQFHVRLARPIGPNDIVGPLSIRVGGVEYAVYARGVLSRPAYYYPKDDLGATCAPSHTVFKVWSPVSTSVDLLLYAGERGGVGRMVSMRRGNFGVWWAEVAGNLDGKFYCYRYNSYGALRTAPDIYARAASADLTRSMVVDLARTNPAGWRADRSPQPASPADAVAYELHIRDFTIDPSSGVPASLRGKYAGMTYSAGDSASPRGFDYLRKLGVTDVQIMPFQSIHPRDGGSASVDTSYNWGYETDLFDVPEPRYAADPDDPASVIREVKSMVAAFHRAHIGVIMDVVYNHTMPKSGDRSPFWCAAPYYYFRTDDAGKLRDESGVGNAMDDDDPMARKYIVDSLLYWTREYHVDGFRFDLLGMFEPSTVRAISTALHRQDPGIILYGEPWTGGGPTRFGKGAQAGTRVAVFNDEFRTDVRGDLDGTQPGFAMGGDVDTVALRTAIEGSPDFTSAPTESANYASIHDDLCLFDKIRKAMPGADRDTMCRALRLAGAMVLLSQGVPILEGGAELGRTKDGNPNSVFAGDAVNRFDWRRADDFRPVANYYAALIALRRAHPAFRCATAEEVGRSLAFLPESALPPKTAAFTLDGTVRGDRWHKILVVFHGSTAGGEMTLPQGAWHAAILGDRADAGGTLAQGLLTLAPLSAYVLYQ